LLLWAHQEKTFSELSSLGWTVAVIHKSNTY